MSLIDNKSYWHNWIRLELYVYNYTSSRVKGNEGKHPKPGPGKISLPARPGSGGQVQKTTEVGGRTKVEKTCQ